MNSHQYKKKEFLSGKIEAAAYISGAEGCGCLQITSRIAVKRKEEDVEM